MRKRAFTKEDPMKKGLSILLALAVIAAACASCGQAPQAKTVTVWCWDPNFNGYSMKQAAAAYSKSNPKATIEIVDIPENIEGKIEAGLQAGGAGLPDIALFQDFSAEKFIQNYPGAFVDLKAAGVDYSKFAAYKVGPMSEGKKIYGIPFDTGSTGLWLRSDIIKAAGLDPDDYLKPMTWKEIIDLGVKVKAKTKKPLISYDDTSFDFLRIMVQSTGTQFFDPKGGLSLRTPAMKAAIEVLKEMNDKGLLYHTEGWNNWIAALNGGDTVGFMNAIWMVATIKSKAENAGKWMVVPTPLLEGVSGAQNASNNGGSSWFVFAKGKNKAGAIDFLKATWASEKPEALAFYNDILKGAGAMGTFLPSRSGSNYTANDEFFYKNQAVYKDFSTWMEKVPVLMYTPNYSTMRTAVNNAVLLLFKGDIKTADDAISGAEAEYKQTSGQ
jgi:lactose/L-arabinose transport system substrate-binding protein